jgi:hypothetical protein
VLKQGTLYGRKSMLAISIYRQSESTTFAFCENKFFSTGGQFPNLGNWKTRHQGSTLEKIKLTVNTLILKYWSIWSEHFNFEVLDHLGMTSSNFHLNFV